MMQSPSPSHIVRLSDSQAPQVNKDSLILGIIFQEPGANLTCLWAYYTAAAAAKSLQLCPTLCNPIDGSPSGSSSLEFSRQEHWSGLPFPSPMHESGK